MVVCVCVCFHSISLVVQRTICAHRYVLFLVLGRSICNNKIYDRKMGRHEPKWSTYIKNGVFSHGHTTHAIAREREIKQSLRHRLSFDTYSGHCGALAHDRYIVFQCAIQYVCCSFPFFDLSYLYSWSYSEYTINVADANSHHSENLIVRPKKVLNHPNGVEYAVHIFWGSAECAVVGALYVLSFSGATTTHPECWCGCAIKTEFHFSIFAVNI